MLRKPFWSNVPRPTNGAASPLPSRETGRRDYAFMYGNADDWDEIRECREKSMRAAMGEILAAREAEKDADREGAVDKL